MPPRSASSVGYVLFLGLLWAVALPAVLIVDAAGTSFPWRGWPSVVASVLLLGAGLALADSGAGPSPLVTLGCSAFGLTIG